MSIIDKLGITPGKMVSCGLEEGKNIIAIDDVSILSVHHEFDPISESHKPWGIIPNKNDCDLFAAAPEMLEALILLLVEQENIPAKFSNDTAYLNGQEIIEKATGKTWKEIEELNK